MWGSEQRKSPIFLFRLCTSCGNGPAGRRFVRSFRRSLMTFTIWLLPWPSLSISSTRNALCHPVQHPDLHTPNWNTSSCSLAPFSTVYKRLFHNCGPTTYNVLTNMMRVVAHKECFSHHSI